METFRVLFSILVLVTLVLKRKGSLIRMVNGRRRVVSIVTKITLEQVSFRLKRRRVLKRNKQKRRALIPLVRGITSSLVLPRGLVMSRDPLLGKKHFGVVVARVERVIRIRCVGRLLTRPSNTVITSLLLRGGRVTRMIGWVTLKCLKKIVHVFPRVSRMIPFTVLI